MINGSNGHVNNMGKYEQLKKKVKIKIDKISKYGLEKKKSAIWVVWTNTA